MKAEARGGRGARDADARERILAAAENLFAERGFAGTSMQTIADAASVNKAMLYYYFKNKRDLYRSVIRDGLDEMGRLMDEVAGQTGSALEKVSEIARRSYLAIWERPGVLHMIHRELYEPGERSGVRVTERARQHIARVESIIREGIERGELRAVDPAMAVRSLFGMLHVFIKDSFLNGEAYSPDEVIRHTVDLYCRGIAK